MMRTFRYIPLMLALLCITGSAEAATRCLTRQFDEYRSMVREVPPIEMVARHTDAHPMTPPDNPDVGDSWLWYTWLHMGGPHYAERMCTVRGDGENVYVVVEDSQWLTTGNQADVDAIVEAWDNSSIGYFPDSGIYELDTTYFGPAPDALDNDPKIYILYYDFDISADGFFWVFDQYPDGTQDYASNECEVLYMNSSDYDPGGDYLIAVQAHEFEHMIHWLADENESAWVDEGMAEMGMWLYGRPETIGGFHANPDNNLTSFSLNWADYVKVYLWTLYYFEQLGATPEVTRTVMAEPANSVTGYDNALATLGSPRNFEDLFADWTCANFLDDPSLDQGQYGYLSVDLPTFSSITKNTYPLPPTNGTVNGYATDYVKFIDGLPQRLWFDGTDYANWRPRMLYIDAGTAQSVAEIPLDGVDYGTIDLYDFGETHDTAVLVIAKYFPNATTSYQYGTEEMPAAIGDPAASRALVLHPATPNPLTESGAIQLDLGSTQNVSVRIVDASGRLVRQLAAGVRDAGHHSIEWDGRDEDGDRVPAGVYFVRAIAEDGAASSRWVRVE